MIHVAGINPTRHQADLHCAEMMMTYFKDVVSKAKLA